MRRKDDRAELRLLLAEVGKMDGAYSPQGEQVGIALVRKACQPLIEYRRKSGGGFGNV